MKLLVLCHEYPPVGGGAGAACALLAETYVQAGHQVDVITMALDGLPAEEVIAGVLVRRIPCGRRRKELSSAVEGLRWANRCSRLLARQDAVANYDAVHAHFVMPAGIVAWRLKRRFGLPYVLTAHGSDVPGYNRERLGLIHTLVRPWWRRICREASPMVSPSASLAGLIQRAAPQVQPALLPYAVPGARFNGDSEKEQRILLCSRLVERKGVHHFLRAVAEERLPGWSLDIVGSGPLLEEVQQRAAECRMTVRVHGWIDNRDPRLSDLYRKAALFVLPSEWENFPVSLLEAMAAGCAIVTTNVSGMPEVVGDTAVLVPPKTYDTLRDAVVELSRDEPRRIALGLQARERALTEFAAERVGGRYLELLTMAKVCDL